MYLASIPWTVVSNQHYTYIYTSPLPKHFALVSLSTGRRYYSFRVVFRATKLTREHLNYTKWLCTTIHDMLQCRVCTIRRSRRLSLAKNILRHSSYSSNRYGETNHASLVVNRIQKACHDIKLLGRLPRKVTSNNGYKLFACRLVFGLELVNAFVPAEDRV